MKALDAGFTQKEAISNKLAISIIGVLSFTIITALGAYVRIPLPFTPVPITLQTFFVLFAGLVLKAIAASWIYSKMSSKTDLLFQP